MLGKHPSEVCDRSVRTVLDRLADYPSVAAAAKDLGLKLNVGTDTLRRWVMQAQADAGMMPAATTEWKGLNKPHRQDRKWVTAWSPGTDLASVEGRLPGR